VQKKIKISLSAFIIVLVIAGELFAAPVTLNMETHPQDEGWLLNTSYYGTGTSSVGDGALRVESNSSYIFNPVLETNLYNDIGWIVKARVRISDIEIINYNNPEITAPIVDPDEAVGSFIQVSDNIRYVTLQFYRNKVKIDGYFKEISLDMSQFHEFKLVGNLNSIRLYVDGAMEIEWKTVQAGGTNQSNVNLGSLSFGIDNERYWIFGDQIYPGVRSVSEWDYVEYDQSPEATEDSTDEDAMYLQYMPEGYTDFGVSEFIGVLNSSAQPATGDIIFCYADGTEESYPVYFPEYQRATLDIQAMGIKEKMAFSTVLKTDRKVTATFMSYNHGMALGENFTDIKSTRWGVAEGLASKSTSDFLCIFNPNTYPVDVEVTIHPNPWRDGLITVRVDAKSRATLALNDFITDNFYPFAYGITLESTGAVVASMSRYDFGFNDAMLFMATPNIGEASGYVADGIRTDRSYSYLDFLNVNGFGVNIALTINYIDGISHTTEHYMAANQWRGIELNEDIVSRENVPYSIEYESTIDGYYWYQQAPVLADFVHAYPGRMEGVRFQQKSHRYWEFAEGYRSASENQISETLQIFNPSESVATGSVTLYYDDGVDPTVVTFRISSHEKAIFEFEKIAEIRAAHSWGGISYGIRIDSDTGVIPHFSHQDKHSGGSFALNGTGWD